VLDPYFSATSVRISILNDRGLFPTLQKGGTSAKRQLRTPAIFPPYIWAD
jgi:hypothetical protein